MKQGSPDCGVPIAFTNRMTKKRVAWQIVAYLLFSILTGVLPVSSRAANSCKSLHSHHSVNPRIEQLEMQLTGRDLSNQDIAYIKKQIQSERSRLDASVRNVFSGGFREAESISATSLSKSENKVALNLAMQFLAERNSLLKLWDRINELEFQKAAKDFLKQYVNSNKVLFPSISRVDSSVELAIQASKSIKLPRRNGELGTSKWGGEEMALRGRQFEGEVADYVRSKWGDIISFNENLRDPMTNGHFETDIKMGRAFIEITNASGGKSKQIFERYFSKFVNPDGLPVILYGPNFPPQTATYILKRSLQEGKPVLIVRSIDELNLVLGILYN